MCFLRLLVLIRTAFDEGLYQLRYMYVFVGINEWVPYADRWI